MTGIRVLSAAAQHATLQRRNGLWNDELSLRNVAAIAPLTQSRGVIPLCE